MATLTRFLIKMLITISGLKILGILKQIFLKPILANISYETCVFNKLLILWAVFMTKINK